MALSQGFLLWQEPLPLFPCRWVAVKHGVPRLGVNTGLASSISNTWLSPQAETAPAVPLARGESSRFLSPLRPPWAVDLQAGEPRESQLPAEVPGVDGAAAGAAGVEPGPACLPLLPAARAAGPALQEQPRRQVDMPLPHPPRPQDFPSHLPCKGGWGPFWPGGQATPRKMRRGGGAALPCRDRENEEEQGLTRLVRAGLSTGVSPWGTTWMVSVSPSKPHSTVGDAVGVMDNKEPAPASLLALR